MNTGNRSAVNLKGERVWVADSKGGKVGSVIEPAHRVCILVLGAHRSGTSALTRVISLLGCDLPKTLSPANNTNEAGQWETPAIYRLNDRILQSAGTNWHDWLEFNPGWLQSPRAEEFREEALAVLREQFGSSRLFVLKDPRICRIAPFWMAVLKDVGVQPLIVSPVRNPLEVAASLKERNGFELSFGHLMWLRHVLDAEFTSRGMPRFFTSYDRLIKGWSRVATEAESTLGIAWPRLSDQAAEEIETFLSERYRHHREAPESVIENPTLSKWLRDTFQIFNNWTVAGEKPEDFPALDQIRGELNTAAPTFARLIASGQKAFEKSRALEQKLTETRAKLHEAEAASTKYSEKVKRLKEEVTAARWKLNEKDKQILCIKAELDEASCAAEEAKNALNATRDELTQTKYALTQRRNEIEQAKVEKRQLEARLKDRFDEITILTRLMQEREGEAHQKEQQANRLRETAASEIGRAVAALLDGRSWRFLSARARRKRKMALLKRSGLFDPEWYLHQYPDVADAGLDPLRHYVEFGAREGRAPNATLDGEFDENDVDV